MEEDGRNSVNKKALRIAGWATAAPFGGLALGQGENRRCGQAPILFCGGHGLLSSESAGRVKIPQNRPLLPQVPKS